MPEVTMAATHAHVDIGSEGASPASTLWKNWSLEATLPTQIEIDALQQNLSPNTRVFLSALPRVPLASQIAAARQLRRAGFEPVPHLAARKFHSREELSGYLEALAGEADVTRLMVIAGDMNWALGPYRDSMSVLEDDLLIASGIQEVGVSGYPEGHPLIEDRDIDELLDRKIDRCRRSGLSVEVVSQFCFDAAALADWTRRIRARHFAVPIRIGIAGPASLNTLLKLALRCGVNLPMRRINVATRLLDTNTPDKIIDRLLEESIGANTARVQLHFYSFGGLARTSRWAHRAERDFENALPA